MEYSKNQRKRSLMMCFVAIMVFIFGITAGISYAYFSDSKKAENTLNFGKLRIATVEKEASKQVDVSLRGTKQMAVKDSVTLNGSVGLEENSVEAYIRMKMIVKDNDLGAEIESTFNDAFLTAMSEIKNGSMQWFKVGDYLYLGNKIDTNTTFRYNNNKVELTDEMIPKKFQGIDISVTFIFQAIQSAGMKDENNSVIGTLTDYTQANAEKISKIPVWDKVFEPKLNEIYHSKYATECVRGALDNAEYKKDAQVMRKMTKSPYSYFTRSKGGGVGNYVAFGFFPQTIMANDVVVKESWKETFNGVGYYLGSDGYLYERVRENANESNYVYSNGDSIKQLNVESYKYFKLEPIIWQVLTESNGSAFLLSVSALTAKEFGSNTTYSKSTIEIYLTGTFYKKAFTEGAKNKINNKVKVDTAENGDGTNDETTIGTSSTSSTVFLLGYKDVINANYGFNSSESVFDTSRVRYPTDYAGANHINRYNDASNGSLWWLRSRSASNGFARSISFNGHAGGNNGIANSNCGCVPALFLNI